MKDASRVITGIVVMVFGLSLMSIPLFTRGWSGFFSWIYGVPILIVGIIIFLNKKEDDIEPIKQIRKN